MLILPIWYCLSNKSPIALPSAVKLILPLARYPLPSAFILVLPPPNQASPVLKFRQKAGLNELLGL